MPNLPISGLPAVATVLSTDQIPSVQGGVTKKVTVSQLQSFILGDANAMVYKGAIDASTEPDYPAGNAGDVYIFSVAGKIGGAAGTVVAQYDMMMCSVDGSLTGDEAAVGGNWNKIEGNIISAGTPGGSTTQIQYNNAGVFAGSSDFTWDDTSKILYVNGKMTLTGSLDPTDVMLTGGYQRIYGKVPTTADTAGENMFIEVDPGTGTAAGGSWEVRTADAGTVSGTTPNALYTRFKVHADGHSEFADAVITQYRNITDVPTGGVTMFQQNLNIDSPANTTEYVSMGNATTIVPTGNTADYLNFQGAAYQFTHQGTGTIGIPLSSGNIGYSANISNESTGTIELALPMLSLINNSDAGHIEDAIGFTNVLFNSGSGTIENVVAYNVNAPLINTGSINNVVGVRIGDHSGIGLVKSFNIWSMGANSLNIFDGKIGIGTVGPDASSVIDIVSTTAGVLIPRMDTSDRDSIASPATALMIYNTDTNKFNFYNGTAWTIVGEGDKNYTQAFTGVSSVAVPHNLAKYPAVSIIDSAGNEMVGQVQHVDTNNITVTFTGNNTGTVICN